jgi:hypothetical protein
VSLLLYVLYENNFFYTNRHIILKFLMDFHKTLIDDLIFNECFVSSSPPTKFFLSFCCLILLVYLLKFILKIRLGCARLRFSSVCVPIHVIFVMKVTLNYFFNMLYLFDDTRPIQGFFSASPRF